MSTRIQVFTPRANTVQLAVTAVSQPFPALPAGGVLEYNELRVVNIGTQTVFLNLRGATAALATDMPILPNSVENFAVGEGYSVSAIAAAVGSTLYITWGEGL